VNAGYSFIRADSGRTAIREDIRAAARPLIVVCNGGAEDCDGEGKILDIPQHTVRFGVKVDPIPNLTLTVWGRFTPETWTLDPILNPQPASTIPGMKNWEYTPNPAVVVVDAAVMYTWNKLALQLIAQNVGDTYYERGGTVPRPLARNGLMIEGMVSYQF
jgi:hypothetical protein